MNYIKQLTSFFNKSTADPGFTPTHMSLFMALFQAWNQARFTKKIQIIRDDMMQLSKINSKATYHKSMAYLHQNGYIDYKPSYNPLKGSEISFFPTQIPISKTQDEPVQILTTRPLNEPYNKLYTHIITDNISSHSSVKKESSKNETVSSTNQTQNFQKEKSSAKKEKNRPSSTQQVEEFFLQNKSTTNEANKFINHYTANGWLVGGKSPMIDWKASAKNWIANTAKFNTHDKQQNLPRAQHLHSKPNKNYFEPL